MDFDFSDDQKMLKDQVQKFLTDKCPLTVVRRVLDSEEAYAAEVWQGLIALGLPGAAIPERYGGMGLGALELCVVAEELGRACAPVPFSSTVYLAVRQVGYGGRLFVRTSGDPYALVPEVTRVIRELAADQPVERAATLGDVRAAVLSSERLNAFVLSGFAGIALLIAVVGVAGVLAFSVSARTREFGVRLAVGASPTRLLARVLAEGAGIATLGIAAGALGGLVLERLARAYVENVRSPGALPVLSAAALLIVAAVVASLMPAARASRVDVVQALRSE